MTATINLETGLRLERASLGYGTRVVVPELDFAVPAGEFTAIVGPNGCGKTTVLKSLSRTLAPLSGRVTLDGLDLSRIRPKLAAKRIASLPQDPLAPESLKVGELVRRGRHPYHSVLRQWVPGDDEAVAESMAATAVTELADRLLTELSGGQRQRAWLAMVLAQQTDYVLLDEPTSFLDIAHQIEVLHLCQDIRDAGRTVVAVLHDLNQAARYASHLVVMSEGRVKAEGPPHDVLTSELVRETFGLDCVIERDSQSGSPMVIARTRQAR